MSLSAMIHPTRPANIIASLERDHQRNYHRQASNLPVGTSRRNGVSIAATAATAAAAAAATAITAAVVVVTDRVLTSESGRDDRYRTLGRGRVFLGAAREPPITMRAPILGSTMQGQEWTIHRLCQFSVAKKKIYLYLFIFYLSRFPRLCIDATSNGSSRYIRTYAFHASFFSPLALSCTTTCSVDVCCSRSILFPRISALPSLFCSLARAEES